MQKKITNAVPAGSRVVCDKFRDNIAYIDRLKAITFICLGCVPKSFVLQAKEVPARFQLIANLFGCFETKSAAIFNYSSYSKIITVQKKKYRN